MRIDADHIDNENAEVLLEAGLAAVQAGDTAFDLGGVARCDSAAVALLLALRRAARATGRDLQLTGVPASIANLATLYGVEDLLPGIALPAAARSAATPG